MIKKVRICNYKCYGPRGADFNLSKINFIFGDNSSGKSTFLQFLGKIYDICNLEGKCDGDIIDKHRYKNQKGDAGVVSAKLRVFIDGADHPGEAVWDLKKTDAYYVLQDSTNGGFVGIDKLREVLSPNGRKLFEHVIASRKNATTPENEETTSLEKRFAKLIDDVSLASEQDGVNSILERLGIPYSCVIEADGKSVSRVMIHDKDFDMNLLRSEVGTGIDGLFDLAMTLNAWEGGILAIEEPETNVNEEQLDSLMNVLVEEAMKRPDGQLFVECHSELMFLELRNLLKKGGLKLDDVSIIVVQKSANGSVATQIPLDRFGNILSPWPGGFFPKRVNITDEYYKQDTP